MNNLIEIVKGFFKPKQETLLTYKDYFYIYNEIGYIRNDMRQLEIFVNQLRKSKKKDVALNTINEVNKKLILLKSYITSLNVEKEKENEK